MECKISFNEQQQDPNILVREKTFSVGRDTGNIQ